VGLFQDPVEGWTLSGTPPVKTRAFAAGATGQALPYGIALQDLSGRREHAWRKRAQIHRQMQAETWSNLTDRGQTVGRMDGR
jgi:hypothetical protein